MKRLTSVRQTLKGRNPTTAEKKWLNAISELGCIVCLLEYGLKTPASPHHIDGKTKPNAHFKTIPLCGRHHQIPDDSGRGQWIARHENKSMFESRYGTEESLLEMVKELV